MEFTRIRKAIIKDYDAKRAHKRNDIITDAGYFVHVTGTLSTKCLDAMRRAKK